MGVIDRWWHYLKCMEFVPAEQINAETGTLDDNCTCVLCHLKGRVDAR